MAVETKTAVQIAQAQAAEALAAAERARDAEQVAFFDSVTNVRQLNTGTDFQNRQNRSRYITLFGLARFTALIRDSR
ncbi:MAG: hypothetical protein WCC22_20815 [Terriglobales bacterium]